MYESSYKQKVCLHELAQSWICGQAEALQSSILNLFCCNFIALPTEHQSYAEVTEYFWHLSHSCNLYITLHKLQGAMWMFLEVVVVKTPVLLGYETLCPNFGRVYIRNYRLLISSRNETLIGDTITQGMVLILKKGN